MNVLVSCPKCDSTSVQFINELNKYLCLRCTHVFAAAAGGERQPHRVFLSYGHDVFAEDVAVIKQDLEARGHQVWYDADRLRAGTDFELYIEQGLNWCDTVVVAMTPHSIRRQDTRSPSSTAGYCLNEIAKALASNKRIIPVYLVTVEDGPPTSICRLDYVEMRDCVHFCSFPEKYRSRFARLVDAIENDRFDGEGAQSRLFRLLRPLAFEAEIGKHLAHFTGREWITQRLDEWLMTQPESRVFWLLGGPGIGKSAIASHWCHTRGDVIAYHLCVHGHSEKADPKRILLSLAAQMTTHLPEYYKRLSALPLEDTVNKNAKAVFDDLLFAPLKGNFPEPGRDQLVIIDALDEASHGDENELADFIAESWGELPRWLRLVFTSRPEAAVMTRLVDLPTVPLHADSPENLRDIRMFLQVQLAAMGVTASDASLDELVRKSEGMFLYATVVLAEIRAGRLSIDQLADFPEGLSGYYGRWFAREFPDPNVYRAHFHRLVSAIIAQRAPLPLDVLGGAVDLSSHELHQRLLRLATLFPRHQERSGLHTAVLITPLHRSLRDWLADPHPVTQLPKAGRFAVDPELGNRLLADHGWLLFQRGDLIGSPYYSRTITRHLAGAGDTDRLLAVLLDPGLLDTFWSKDHRYEWLRHVAGLRGSIPLSDAVRQWLQSLLTSQPASPRTPPLVAKLGHLLQELGDFEDAAYLATEALRLWDCAGVADSPDMVETLLGLGNMHRLRDDFGKALPYYERAAAITQRAFAPESSETADVFYQLCVFHKERRDYVQSWECLEKCLRIREHADPPDYAGMADCVNDKAILLSAQCKPADYLATYREALALFERAHPEGHPEMATVLDNIGTELRHRGKAEEALAALQRGLAMAESFLMPHHPKCQSLRSGLAGSLLDLGRYAEALNLMRANVKQVAVFPGPEHEETAGSRLQLCQVIGEVLRYDEHAPRVQLRTEAREQCAALGRARPATALGLLYLSNALHRSGEPELSDCALQAATRASEQYAQRAGREEPERIAAACFAEVVGLVASGTAIAEIIPQITQCWERALPGIHNHADCLARARREIVQLVAWAGQTPLLRAHDVGAVRLAFDLVSQIGADNPDTLDQLAVLAATLHYQRCYEASEALCEVLLERSERVLGPEHVQTLTYVENLADLRQHCGRFADSERLYRRSFAARSKVSGIEQTASLASLASLVACILLRGGFEEAAQLTGEVAAKLPPGHGPGSARRILADCLSSRAIELKNERAAYDAARHCYQLSLSLFPENARAHSNLSLLLWSCLHDPGAAAQHFETAVALDPADGNLHSNYALFLTHGRRDPAAARDHFEKALLLLPADYAIPGNYATWAIVQGDLAHAWRLARRAMDLCRPHPDRIMARPLVCAAAVLLLEAGDPTIPLGQMRTLFAEGIDHVAWVVDAMLEYLDAHLAPDWSGLFRAISRAIADKGCVPELDALPCWQALPLVTLDTAWPERPRC